MARRFDRAVVLLLLAGCGRAPDAKADAPETADPGVVRVSRAQYTQLPRLTLARDAVVCPDTSRAVCHFARIIAHAVGPHDVSAIFDTGGEETGGTGTRIFDSSGAYVRAVGRAGRGPGEHGMSIEIGFDSALGLTVYDANSAMIHQFDSTGALRSSGRGPRTTGLFAVELGIGDGRVVMFYIPRAATGDSADAQFLVSDGDTAMRQLATVRARALRTASGSQTPLEGFYTAVPSWSAAPGAGPTIVHTPGDRYVIQRIDSAGQRELLIEVDAPLDSVSADDLAVARARWTGMLSRSGVPDRASLRARDIWRLRMTVDRRDRPSVEDEVASAEARAARAHPAISGLEVGVDGTIWAREERKALGDSTRWTGFRPDGIPIGYFILPRKSSLLGGTRQRVLALETDSLDVPVPVWYRLYPPVGR
jgi:hypothetical protein